MSNVRISDLPPATIPLVGDELLEVTQDGLSRKVLADDLIPSVPGIDASFVTVSANPDLDNERIIAPGTGINIVDGGAGALLTIAVDEDDLTIDELYFGMVLVGQTVGASSGGLEVNNTLTGAGFERVLTESDLTGSEPPALYDGGVIVAQGIPAASGGLEANNTLTGGGLERVLTVSDLAGGGTGVFAQVTATNNAVPDLSDTNVALRVGASNPDISPHLEAAAQFLQAKADQTSVATLFVQSLGGDLSLGQSGDCRVLVEQGVNVTLRDGGVDVAQTTSAGSGGLLANNQDTGSGLERVLTTSDLVASIGTLYDGAGDGKVEADEFGCAIFGSSAEDNDPDTGGSQDVTLYLLNFSGFVAGQLWYDGDPHLALTNYVRDGEVQIQGTNTALGTNPMIVADPNGEVELWHAGGRKLITEDDGMRLNGSSMGAVGASQTSHILLYNANNALVGEMGFSGSSDLAITSRNHGGALALQAEDVGGSLQTLIYADPDGSSSLYHSGAVVLASRTAANGGAVVNNTLTGTGFERVLTVSDLGAVASFTPTFTGFSAAPSSPVVRYFIQGNLVTVMLDFSVGTSNATTFTINNVPAAIRPSLTQMAYVASAIDNTANVSGCTVRLQAASASWLFGMGHNNPNGGGWTAAGSKGLGNGDGWVFSYFLNHS